MAEAAVAEQGELFAAGELWQPPGAIPLWTLVPNAQDACVELDEAVAS